MKSLFEISLQNSVLSHAYSKRSLTIKRLLSTAVQHRSEMDLVSHFPTVRYPDVIKETLQYSITLTFLLTFYWNKEKYIKTTVHKKNYEKHISKTNIKRNTLKIYQESYLFISLYIISEKTNFLSPVFNTESVHSAQCKGHKSKQCLFAALLY